MGHITKGEAAPQALADFQAAPEVPDLKPVDLSSRKR